MRHDAKDMGAAEVEASFAMLANERNVSAPTVGQVVDEQSNDRLASICFKDRLWPTAVRCA